MANKAILIILCGVIIALSAALIGVLLFIKNQPAAPRGVLPIVEIAPMEPDSARWGINFPQEYSTFLLTSTNNKATIYGGSEPYSKLERDPRLVKLYAGYSFSKDYNEERGHLNSLIDVRETKRVNEKTAGTCYSCKSADNPKLWATMGMAEYDRTLFSELGKEISYPIGCANCHEAGTMNLIVTNPALQEALERQGKDWKKFTRQEMRTVVCANCHVEYYFQKGSNYLTFPWEKGTRIEDIASYYDEMNFSDWQHADSKANLIKMQHPDYELFTADSTHYKAGVACADCHMPYTRIGAAKFSQHDVKSPLLSPETSCGTCHTDVDYVVDRVKLIQDSVWEAQTRAEEALVDAIEAIAKAEETTTHSTLLDEARKLHREAQLRWDFVASENSMGFHNSQEALRILTAATDLARQAQIMALKASNVQEISLIR